MVFNNRTQTGKLSDTCLKGQNDTATDEVSQIYHYIVGSLLSLTTLGSILTNGSVIYVLLIKQRSFHNRINVYVIAVCVLALIMASIGCPLVVSSSFAEEWLFGDGGCVYYGFLMTFCGIATIFILTLISVDRYVSVVHDAFRGSNGRLFITTGLIICFLISLVMAICPMVGWNRYKLEPIGTACSPDIEDEDVFSRMYLATLLFLCFLVPLTVMVVCYGKLFSTVRESRRQVYGKADPNPAAMSAQRKMDIELQLACTILCIVGTFILCWIPYSVTLVMSVFYPDTLTPIGAAIPSIIAKIGCWLLPLTYIGRDRQMRTFFRDILQCFRSADREGRKTIDNSKIFMTNHGLPRTTTTKTVISTTKFTGQNVDLVEQSIQEFEA